MNSATIRYINDEECFNWNSVKWNSDGTCVVPVNGGSKQVPRGRVKARRVKAKAARKTRRKARQRQS